MKFYYANETIHSKYIMQIQTDMEQQQKSVFTGCEQPALMMAHGDHVG